VTDDAAVGRRTALVFGGSGQLGSEIVRGLVARGVRTAFTYLRGRARADALAREADARSLAVDLSDGEAIRSLLRGLEADGLTPDVFVHAAATPSPRRLAEVTPLDWSAALAVNVTSAFIAAQELAPRLRARGGGDLVFLGGLDRTQSVPAPIAFAATQGALSAMTMALGKELGRDGIRVNMLATGILDAGMSRDMDPRWLADYRTFSALRRTGTAAEVARVAVWLALENSYMTGRVVTANGGL
jgi:NAD(P)-dependent dehydrogenase (short-subunit alcohol dehydrogenase family)